MHTHNTAVVGSSRQCYGLGLGVCGEIAAATSIGNKLLCQLGCPQHVGAQFVKLPFLCE